MKNFGMNSPLIVPPKGKPSAQVVINVDDTGRTELKSVVFTALGAELPMDPLAMVSLLLQIITPAIMQLNMNLDRVWKSGGDKDAAKIV